MRSVTVAVVQMQCAKEVEANIAKADAMVREAAAKGAKIILLPELFERPYFCQERQYEYYAYATPTAQHPGAASCSRPEAVRPVRSKAGSGCAFARQGTAPPGLHRPAGRAGAVPA